MAQLWTIYIKIFIAWPQRCFLIVSDQNNHPRPLLKTQIAKSRPKGTESEFKGISPPGQLGKLAARL